MGDAKQLIVKPISSQDANRIIKQLHYSGKVVNNSQLHLGVFMGDRCGGAMQFGPSTAKRNLIGLVGDTGWNGFIELNRMAFADWLPRNGESRCIGYAMRWIRKQYPHLKWVISFADGTQCGDGTIYRASGFVLTGIKENHELHRMPNGEVLHQVAAKTNRNKAEFFRITKGASSWPAYVKATGAVCLEGFMLRYIYFLDSTARDRLTVPVLPFSEIDRRGAGMYKGKQRLQSCAGSDTTDTPAIPAGEGGSTPTPALQPQQQAQT
jgi:hypothetical protein